MVPTQRFSIFTRSLYLCDEFLTSVRQFKIANNPHHRHKKEKKLQGGLTKRLVVTVKNTYTEQKMRFPIKDLLSKCDQICKKQQIFADNVNMCCRGIFRTQLDIYDGAFFPKIVNS